MYQNHLAKSLIVVGLVALGSLTMAIAFANDGLENSTLMVGTVDIGGATVGCRSEDNIPNDWSQVGTYDSLENCLNDFDTVKREYMRSGQLVPGPNSQERTGAAGGGDEVVCNCEHQDETVHLCSEGRTEAECTDLQAQNCEPRPFSYEPCNRTNAVQCCNGPDWTMVLYSNFPEFEQVCVQNGGTIGSC